MLTNSINTAAPTKVNFSASPPNRAAQEVVARRIVIAKWATSKPVFMAIWFILWVSIGLSLEKKRAPFGGSEIAVDRWIYCQFDV